MQTKILQTTIQSIKGYKADQYIYRLSILTNINVIVIEKKISCCLWFFKVQLNMLDIFHLKWHVVLCDYRINDSKIDLSGIIMVKIKLL